MPTLIRYDDIRDAHRRLIDYLAGGGPADGTTTSAKVVTLEGAWPVAIVWYADPPANTRRLYAEEVVTGPAITPTLVRRTVYADDGATPLAWCDDAMTWEGALRTSLTRTYHAAG